MGPAVGTFPPSPRTRPRLPRGRLLALLTAGLVDSLLLSMAWTVIILQVTSRHGLSGAGTCGTAMLVGVACAAPFAAWLSRRLEGRRLLRLAGAVEAVLRVSVLGLLWAGAPVWALATCVAAMNVVAWTGYAGMRAEVAAVSDGAVALTWYGTVVAAVEAIGVASAAVLPLSSPHLGPRLMLGMAVVYVLGLVPTIVVAGRSSVPRAPATVHPAGGRRFRAPTLPVAAGSSLMLLASAPTLLSVALASELHGRAAVGLSAVSFTVGSMLSPWLAARVQKGGANGPVAWMLVAAGMVAGWALAPLSTAGLCLAQLCSGLCMTALEGLLDASAAASRPSAVTAALARTTAGRALGSAAGAGLLPLAVGALGLSLTAALVTATLLIAAFVARSLLGLLNRSSIEVEA